MGDGDILKMGASADLQIYHDGSNSFIKDTGTGNLLVQATHLVLENAAGNQNYLQGVDGGAVSLYYSGSSKLATATGGVTVTGNIANTSGDMTLDVAGNIILDADGGDVKFLDGGTETLRYSSSGDGPQFFSPVADKDIIFKGKDGSSTITALTLDMSAAGKALFNSGAAFAGNVDFADNAKIVVGSGDDLQIKHDGNNSFITEVGTGNLYIESNSIMHLLSDDIRLMNAGNSETMLTGVVNGAVTLYHDNVIRLTTTSTGVVLGSATANTNFELNLNGVASKATRIQFQEGGANKWLLGQGAASETSAFELFNAGGTIALSVNRSTNVATFAAGIAITAGDLVIPGSIIHAGDTDTKLDFNQADTMRLITGDTTAWICNGSSMVVNEDSADFDFRVESNGNSNMFFVDGGNNRVGIGTATPAQTLHVAGSVFAAGYYITNLQGNSQLTSASTSSGSLACYIGQGLISVSVSDAKAKENFSGVEENECLNKIVSLAGHVKKFDWIDEDWKKEKGRTVGMVAQEIYEDHSEFVHKPENYNDDGWAIRYQEIVPTLTKAIQEQQTLIESLTARLETLEG
jgi:hypothetical protein